MHKSDHATKSGTLVRTDGKELTAQFCQPAVAATEIYAVEKSVMVELPSWRNFNLSSLRNNDVDLVGTTLNQDQDEVYNANPITPYYYVPLNQTPPLSTSARLEKDIDVEHFYQSNDYIEWTSQDSSYCVAVQACGWISKRQHKLAEGIILIIVIALLIFVLVKTGVHLKSAGSGAEDRYLSDDDHNVAYDANVDNHDNSSNNHRGGNDHNKSRRQ